MNEYIIECVDKLRIHELRDLSKNVGVASPTTLKKEELIAKITEAMQENSRLEMVGALPRKRRGLDFFSLLMTNNSDILNQMIAGGKVYNTVNGEIDCDFDTPLCKGYFLQGSATVKHIGYRSGIGNVHLAYLNNAFRIDKHIGEIRSFAIIKSWDNNVLIRLGSCDCRKHCQKGSAVCGVLVFEVLYHTRSRIAQLGKVFPRWVYLNESIGNISTATLKLSFGITGIVHPLLVLRNGLQFFCNGFHLLRCGHWVTPPFHSRRWW